MLHWKRFGLAGFIALSLGAAALPAHQAVMDPKARLALNLDGKWNAIVDPYDVGYYNYRLQPYDESADPSSGFFNDRAPASKSDLVEYSFDRSPTLTVPKDWNSQDSKLFYYEGAVWYRRKFDFAPPAGARVFLHIGAANYESQVYLNAKKLGAHVGGFTPYDVEVTGALQTGGNSLVIRVDNRRHAEAVPTVNTDWWNYGGLTRDVYLYTTPATVLSRYTVRLKPGDSSQIEVAVELSGPQLRQSLAVAIPELQLSASAATDAQGRATLLLRVPTGLIRWSPEHPKCYVVTIQSDSDRVAEKIGFRTIEVRGSDILLNGEPIFLRGVCIHEENPIRGGRAYSREDAQLLLGWAKQLNCNFARLAHYPHNEHMAEVADEMGILLWEEIPVYWTIAWDNPATLRNARDQLNDLIVRDHNRASVIVWSVANETPVTDARTRFLRQLIEDARALDGTRLVSAAMEVRKAADDPHHRIVDDPLGAYTDLLSFNEYIGWYDGTHETIPLTKWTIGYHKPIVISEFGGDAAQGFHADNLTRFSEEYQAELYRKTIPMLRAMPDLRGMNPWILCDFRSPRRLLPNVEDGWNRKGLIGENGVRKAAFSVLADFYAQIRDQGYVLK
jgi:beta-glucuronidase